MANSNKPLSDYDQTQIIQKVFNPADGTLAVGSFLGGQLGNRVERTAVSATIDQFSYFDGQGLLYTIEIEYDDANHTNVDRAERIA